MEEAFQMAIRIFPRQGRKKHDLKGKLSGGNEHISEFIKMATGEDCDRKKVSSHLQVLKKIMRDNRLWMSLVAAIKVDTSNKNGRRNAAHEETPGGSENSEYDSAYDYQPSKASYGPLPDRCAPPIEILASNEYPGPTIRRVLEFVMVLKDKHDDEVLHHTYTSIQSETASAPKALTDVNNWREMYPPLATYYDQGQIDCPMFLFDTHLSLMDRLNPHNSGISTTFSLDISQGAQFTDWRSYTRCYKPNGYLVNTPEIELEIEPDPKSFGLLDSHQVKGTDDTRLDRIGFNSKWWVKVFHNMINKRMEMKQIGDPKLIKEEEERAIQYVQGITVMQEIWATHPVYDHRQQRMAILLWKFSAARRGEVATTSWRRISSAYEVQSPHPPSENPPMTLDTTLEAASPYVAHYTTQPSVFSENPTADLLAAPLSENSSPSMTPTPESRPFPSSTSTSFPSSISDSSYPVYSSQESSFQSQDSAYPGLGSLDSQDSAYPALVSLDSQGSGYALYEHHDIVEASHESYESHEFADGSQESYRSEEVVYHSQDSLYQQAPDQLYEYPYEMVDAPVTASTHQDFTGGQIQLSYAPTEDCQSSYEAPLIAPQASMMPQHQLIQHPEHFDQHDYVDRDPDDLGGGHDGLDEQAHAQPLLQPFELNGLAMDYDAWEETLRLNPDLERHLGIGAVDEVRHTGQQYVSPLGQGDSGPMAGEVLGEVQDEQGSPNGHLEYQ